MRPLNPFSVREINGSVECVWGTFPRITLAGSLVDQVRSALIEKFGSPHRRDVEIIQTGAGAKYEREILTWSGKNVTIHFRSLAGDIDHADVEAYTRAYDAAENRRDEKRTQELKQTF